MVKVILASVFFISLVGGLWRTADSHAQEFQIRDIMVYRDADSLRLDFILENFFSGKLLKTLQSGITLRIEIGMIVLNQQEVPVGDKRKSARIGYDVWEQTYRLEGMGGASRLYADLPELQSVFQTFKNMGVIDIGKLVAGEAYRCRVSTTVIFLNQEQSESLKWWLEEGEPTEEDLPSLERSTGFKLNLNRLVQLFFNRDNQREEYRREGVSRPFRMEDLQFP